MLPLTSKHAPPTMAELISKAEYMANANRIGREAAHRAYYAQFVTPAHFSRLKNLTVSIETSKDPHFNDIDLRVRDRLSLPVPMKSNTLLHKCGDYPTLCGAVCILKEAAQQIREGSANV
jgi:hypothetical protein